MTSKREVLKPRASDSRYARRDARGRFTSEVDVGRSLSRDKDQRAKADNPGGQGDRGDRRQARG